MANQADDEPLARIRLLELQLQQSEAKCKNAEAKWENAEAERNEEEAKRKTAEAERNEEEAKRKKTAEAERNEEEAKRKTAEAERNEEEAKRKKTAEAERNEEEAKRKTAEAERNEEEAKRKSAEEETEMSRFSEFRTTLRHFGALSVADSTSSHCFVRTDLGVPLEIEPVTHLYRKIEPQVRMEVCGGMQPSAHPAVDAVKTRWSSFLKLVKVRSSVSGGSSVTEAHGRITNGQSDSAIKELRDVHPVVEAALKALVEGTSLKVCHEAVPEDEIKYRAIRPNFLLTHTRDACSSLLGALCVVEVKLPGDLQKAINRTLVYLCRRMKTLFEEAVQRMGEHSVDSFEHPHWLTIYGVATDGKKMCILRMDSGAPPAGKSYKGCIPCKSFKSRTFDLLPDAWNYENQDLDILDEEHPTTGFIELDRLFAQEFIHTHGRPLTKLSCSVTEKISDGVGGSEHNFEGDLLLGPRIGCGGTSDVYQCGSRWPLKWANAETCVVKLPRFTSENLGKHFKAEVDALREMGDCHVPRVVAEGIRVWPAESGAGPKCETPWPFLVLSPRGIPLDLVESLCQSEVKEVLQQLLDALKKAHHQGIIHCDIRPSNVILVCNEENGKKAYLADWGLSRRKGKSCHGCGVAAYACEAVFAPGGCDAQPLVDLIAVAYMYVAMMHGGDGSRAPWIDWQAAKEHRGKPIGAVRDEWLRDNDKLPDIRAINAYVESLLAQKNALEDYYRVDRMLLWDRYEGSQSAQRCSVW